MIQQLAVAVDMCFISEQLHLLCSTTAAWLHDAAMCDLQAIIAGTAPA
jgi:hypothetical protein